MDKMNYNNIGEILINSTSYKLLYEKKLFYKLSKRIFDIFFSICVITFLAPLIIIVSILIKLDSKGPIFYSTTRLGKFGKEIKLYKFRTMTIKDKFDYDSIIDSNDDITLFKIENDPRITALGSFIRKTNIDELPQFFNILKGDLSVVGPRPGHKYELGLIETHNYISRFLVRPGLTGLSQLNIYEKITFEEMITLDNEYIKTASVFLDLKILYKTFINLFKEY